nr:aminotransferase class V-fold PLP-dependent enzyme [Kofleriaceae bacterium]
MLDDWALDPAIVHLNHGSYGGCPRAVVAAAAATRARVEAAPMTYYGLHWQRELDAARARAAAFVGADPARFAFVPGATAGVAVALAAAAHALAAGDELLTTSHAYRACKNQLARIADARGARLVVVPIALPFDPDALVDALLAAVTPRTRVALLDHVTSPTALVLPVDRLVPALAARGVATVVDGAHAPGQLELAVDALGAGWYIGNHHKWLCAPKATGFLVTAASEAARTLPVVTSHGASADYGPPNRYHAELDWAGTHDPAAHLAVPVAIDEVARLGGGWPAIRARNHALAVAMRDQLAAALAAPGHRPRALAPDAAIGAMAAVPIALPAGTPALALQLALLAAGWEVPIVDVPDGTFVRVSAHLYNELSQLDALARELHARGVRARG